MAWNLGAPYSATRGTYVHACSWSECASLFHTDHRAIQHTPTTTCLGQISRLEGINSAFPEPIPLDPRSSKENTLEACRRYNVKPPSLNADLCRSLLAKTDISIPLQDSLVRGWEAGFDLGSKLDDIDHYAPSSVLAQNQENALRSGLLAEVELGRMVGPLKSPLSDEL